MVQTVHIAEKACLFVGLPFNLQQDGLQPPAGRLVSRGIKRQSPIGPNAWGLDGKANCFQGTTF